MPDDIRQIIYDTALASGIDPYLALAVAQQESGFNQYAIGDNGNSFGLFQENVYGRGVGREPDFDPVGQTQRFAADVLRYMNSGGGGSPGDIAYAAQRPADREGYTAKINSLYASLGGTSAVGGGDALVAGEYDPGLFGEEDGGGDQPVDETASENIFQTWWRNLFGGGTPATPATAPEFIGPEGPFDPNTDEIITRTPLAGGAVQVTYDRHGRTLIGVIYPPGTTGGGARSLEQAAALAGYFNPDGSPNTQGYLAAQAAKQGGGTATGPRVVNLGGGRYLTIGPGGIQERSFGGAAGASDLTPPSLEPSRSRIVAYLQALLGQNALPYNAVGAGGAPSVAAGGPAAPTPSAVAPAAPAAPVSGQTLVNVPGAPSPIDISGGIFAQQPQNFLSALNPSLSTPRTFGGPALPQAQSVAPIVSNAPSITTPSYPEDLLRRKLPSLY